MKNKNIISLLLVIFTMTINYAQKSIIYDDEYNDTNKYYQKRENNCQLYHSCKHQNRRPRNNFNGCCSQCKDKCNCCNRKERRAVAGAIIGGGIGAGIGAAVATNAGTGAAIGGPIGLGVGLLISQIT